MIAVRLYQLELSVNKITFAIGLFASYSLFECFGEKTINFAIKCGLIDPDSVIIIDGVPHAQIFRV